MFHRRFPEPFAVQWNPPPVPSPSAILEQVADTATTGSAEHDATSRKDDSLPESRQTTPSKVTRAINQQNKPDNPRSPGIRPDPITDSVPPAVANNLVAAQSFWKLPTLPKFSKLELPTIKMPQLFSRWRPTFKAEDGQAKDGQPTLSTYEEPARLVEERQSVGDRDEEKSRFLLDAVIARPIRTSFLTR